MSDIKFVSNFSGREAMALGVFGGEGSGKTRLLSTATAWARERGKIPAWIVFDRKTRATVRQIHQDNGWELPVMNSDDYISRSEALKIAQKDREDAKQNAEIQVVYSTVVKKVMQSLEELVDTKYEPIILETGTAIWDIISFSHHGKKTNVGMARNWGGPKQDWTDLVDFLSDRTFISTFWEKPDYKDDKPTGKTKPDGPTHLGYTLTSIVRMNCNRNPKTRLVGGIEVTEPHYSLDLYESQENKGLEGTEALLTEDEITFSNLMDLLKPE